MRVTNGIPLGRPLPLTVVIIHYVTTLKARGVREIIFAIGLNQAADFCEERVPPQVQQPLMRNMIGSLTAGVLAGYFSHVPHNLSALKLMNPSLSYMEHFKSYAKSNEERLPKSWSQGQKQTVARVMGIVAPKAVGTVRGFRQRFEDAIYLYNFFAPLEASMCVTNGIPLE
jgi:hypothetical protein